MDEATLALLPADIRGDVAWKDLADVGAMARSYLGQAKLIGAPREHLVQLPADDKPESWAPVWQRLGRPDSPDKYQLADPAPAAIPAGLEMRPEQKTAFAARAHELGLSQKQAAALYEKIVADGIDNWNSAGSREQAALAEVATQLQRELGQTFERTIEDVNAAVDHLDSSLELKGALEAALGAMPAGSRYALTKAFAEIGRQLREDGKLLGKGAAGGYGGLAPAAAQQQIAAKMADPVFIKAYFDRMAPNHKASVEELEALHKQAYPDQAA